jgi:hypothetical protein
MRPDARARPDIRLIHATSIVPLFIVALLAARSIKDNSFLWHIRAGAVQLADERVITSEPFSFTMQGVPWRTQSWLIELVYAYAEDWISGLVWVNVMIFGLGAVTAGLVGMAIYRGTRSPVTMSLGLIAMIWLAGPFLQPRPVLASYVLLAALVVVLQNRETVMWFAVPIIWIWAGVHGSWVIGGGLLILEWLSTFDRRVLKAGIAALVASSLTAHGLGVWQILWDFVGAQEALSLMEEWKVPDFGDIVQAPYLLLVAGIIVAGMRGRLKPRDLIVILPFLFFGMTSRRAVFPAAIVVAPWAALALPSLRVPRSSMSSKLAGTVLALLAIVTVSPLVLSPLGVLGGERFPTIEVQKAITDLHIFHDDAVGGFLIYETWPDRLVYIDDRAELYGAEMLFQYSEVRQGRYEAVFDSYGFEAALSRREWPLTRVLDREGWLRVAEDETFVVFVSPDR